jgi:V8-like Glu-specific endopeptidase
MDRLTRSRAAVFALIAAACASDGDAPRTDTASTTIPIIDGTYDTGDLAVVSLTTANGFSFCTGTLISSRVVLTAGHCVEGLAPANARVYFGARPPGGGISRVVSEIYPHPSYDPDHLTADLGIVVMQARQTEHPPIPFSSTPLDDGHVGASLRFVGFGYTEVGPSGDVGAKYQRANVPLTIVTDTEIGYDVATCNGDSGGPAFLDFGEGEEIVGITSWGDGSCGQFGFSARVDIYADWIAEQIELQDPLSCEKDWRCAAGCGQADPDCPCEPDDGDCSPLCLDTDSDPECPQGCGENGACVAGCPNPDPDCGDPCGPEGHCLVDCEVRDPDCAPQQEVGGDCTSDFDCVNDAVCLADGMGGQACIATCDPANDGCGDGQFCSRVSSTTAVCLDDPNAGGEGCTAAASGRGRVSFITVLLTAALLSFAYRRRHS